MNTFFLSELTPLIFYDGLKLAVDLKRYYIFAWNDYNYCDGNLPEQYLSSWVVFDLTKNIKLFLDYLEGKESLLSVFQKTEYLSCALDEENIFHVVSKDCFAYAEPGEFSFLDGEAAFLVPASTCQIGNDEFLKIEAISFGNKHTNIDFFIEQNQFHEKINRIENAQFWSAFLLGISSQFQTIKHSKDVLVRINLGREEAVKVTEYGGISFFKCELEENQICFFRKGSFFNITDGKDGVLIHYIDFIEILEKICSGIATYFASININPDIVAAWNDRNKNLDEKKIFHLALGFNEDDVDITSLVQRYIDRDIIIKNPCFDSPLLAAARLSIHQLTRDDTLSVVHAVSKILSTAGDTISLNIHNFSKVTTHIPATVFSSQVKYYCQGYALAEYLRNFFSLSPSEPVALNPIYEYLGINSYYFTFSKSVMALSLWEEDKCHVVLNDHPDALDDNNNLIRVTMAHELCHMLIDLGNALPLTEILIEGSPNPIERRARAFAAEFLLPRDVAADFCNTSDKVDISFLSAKYKVSEIVAAQQIINAFNGQMQISTEWLDHAYICTAKYNKSHAF